jgi:hypothetical protein
MSLPSAFRIGESSSTLNLLLVKILLLLLPLSPPLAVIVVSPPLAVIVVQRDLLTQKLK